MRRWSLIIAVGSLLLLVACRHEAEKEPPVPASKPVVFDHAHPGLAPVLAKVSDGFGRVDYGYLHKHPEALQAYLDHAASVPEEQFSGWSKAKRMAFLLNVYNASTLKLMADHYPVQSIKDIRAVPPVWDLEIVRLFGGKYSLGQVEHELLRNQFKSPSIHFALVCGSRGCPPLRREPYTAERLEQQFAEQARAFLGSKEKNYVDVDGKQLFLSPIFKWFREDFGKSDAEIIEFVAEHFPENERLALREGGFAINYTSFDWAANGVPAEK